MKTILFYLTLSFALLIQGQVLAQESTESDVATDKSSFSINIGDEDDEELNPDQQIERAVETVRKLAGDEAGDKLAVELNGLSQEEKKELVNEFKKGFIDLGGMGAGEMVVAIVAIVFSLGMPIIILFMVLIFAHRKRRQKMDVMKAYIDSGRDVPEQVIAEFSGEDVNNFRSGVKLVAIGLGVILALTLSGNSEVAAFGLIPLFIGGARLIFWKFDNRAG